MTVWVLGLDIGQRKTGVAVGQSLTGSATPLGIVEKSAEKLAIADIRAWIDEWRVQAVVIGRPRTADGKAHPLDKAIDRFVALIENELGLPVHEVGEYLSSHEAKARQPKRKKIDDIAACVLVEDFFAR
ncbi:MAG: Holliday junction resolvase RuvX [Cardiobacteriaceae bacterium]|nr:Holliday junction resolvase RuvX [Cardiobacteriaceae bacterium]